jgi:hypothetical protein
MEKKITLLFMAMLLFAGVSWAQSDVPKTTRDLADAIRNNDFTLFERTYTHQAVQGIDPVSGLHPLHLASKLGKAQFVAFMVEQERYMESGIYVTQEEKAPFIHAMEQGHIDVMRVLLEKGLRDANNTWMGKTYLFHAQDLHCGQEVIDFLLKNGADPVRALADVPQWEKYAPEVQALAQQMTAELGAHMHLNRYRKMDADIINLKAAQLLYDVQQKYKDDPAALASEEAALVQFRNKKLQRYLNKEQAVLLKSIKSF